MTGTEVLFLWSMVTRPLSCLFVYAGSLKSSFTLGSFLSEPPRRILRGEPWRATEVSFPLRRSGMAPSLGNGHGQGLSIAAGWRIVERIKVGIVEPVLEQRLVLALLGGVDGNQQTGQQFRLSGQIARRQRPDLSRITPFNPPNIVSAVEAHLVLTELRVFLQRFGTQQSGVKSSGVRLCGVQGRVTEQA